MIGFIISMAGTQFAQIHPGEEFSSEVSVVRD